MDLDAQKKDCFSSLSFFAIYKEKKGREGGSIAFFKECGMMKKYKKVSYDGVLKKFKFSSKKMRRFLSKKTKDQEIFFGFSLLTEEEMDSWSGKRREKMVF